MTAITRARKGKCIGGLRSEGTPPRKYGHARLVANAASYNRRVRPEARLRWPSLAFTLLLTLVATLATVGGTSAGGPTSTAAAPSRAEEKAWLDDAGTAVLGFGLLRVAPQSPGGTGTLSIRYEEKPGDYAAFDSVQLVVLEAKEFATEGRAFANKSLGFSRSPSGAYATEVSVRVTAPTLLVVGYGPFTGPDTGRPLTLARAYTLEVTKADHVSRTFVDAEAGELQIKSWTRRPEIERGGPVRDPVTAADHWFEVRPEIVYDLARVKALGDPETAETLAKRREADTLRSRAKDLATAGKADAAADLVREADDVVANLEASDDRLPVPAPLAARMRRLPFRWK